MKKVFFSSAFSLVIKAVALVLMASPAFCSAILSGVSVAEKNDELFLTVRSSGRVKPELESFAGKLVIKVPNSKLSSLKESDVNLGPVVRIRPGQHGKVSWIVLDLKSALSSPKIEVGKKGFSLDLGPSSSVGEKSRSDSNSDSMLGQDSEPSGDLKEVAGGLTYRVVDLAIQEQDEKCQLVISADGPAKFKSSRLDDGRLISLAIFDSSLAWSQGNTKLSCQGIELVRVKQSDRQGQPSVSIDVHLSEASAFTINRDQNQIILSVDHPAAKETAHSDKGSLDAILSLDVQNADLIGTLTTLAQQAGFETYFSPSMVALAPPQSLVTLHLDRLPLVKILSYLLANISMTYDLQGNTLYFGSVAEITKEKSALPKLNRYYTAKYLDTSVFQKKLTAELAADQVLQQSVNVQPDPDPSSPALLFTATKEDMAKLMAAVSRIDIAPKGEEGSDDAEEASAGGATKTQIFRLRYVDPSTISTAVDQVLTPFQGSEQGVVKTDARTRSLIVTATPKYLRKVQQLLDRLDIQLPQVTIETKIVEVNLADATQLGIIWSAAPNGNPNPNISGSVNAPVGAIGSLTISTLQNNFNINATIEALASKNKAEVLSSPKIMTQDNQQAQIQTSDSITYETLTTTNGPGGTTSQVGFSQQQVPISLQVTPQINQDDNDIRMQVNFNVSSVTGQISPLAPPNLSQQTATTFIKVKNGETAVIGGLVRNLTSINDSKVPILGDIPLLGLLFKSHQVNVTKKELIILLTPTITED